LADRFWRGKIGEAEKRLHKKSEEGTMFRLLSGICDIVPLRKMARFPVGTGTQKPRNSPLQRGKSVRI